MDDLLKIITSPQAWRQHISASSAADLQALVKQVSTYRAEYQSFLDRISDALAELHDHIKERVEEGEQMARQQRVRRARVQLRKFFQRPLPEDRNLEQLELCTKSGATLRLAALTFTLDSESRRVTRVSEARGLLSQGKPCSACWDLYYIRNGTRSAGYGWERPSLDELFVLETPPNDQSSP